MAFKAATACAASAQGKLGRLVVTGVVPCNTGTLIDVATSPPFPDPSPPPPPLLPHRMGGWGREATAAAGAEPAARPPMN
uniref:Uncharacterized protein n=1 Tax=Oryza glumipatula TaxID=40148 RepID=A0A0D9Z743_9ORYZ